MSLILFIAEDSKSSSDILKIDSIINPDTSFMDPVPTLANHLNNIKKRIDQSIFN